MCHGGFVIWLGKKTWFKFWGMLHPKDKKPYFFLFPNLSTNNNHPSQINLIIRAEPDVHK